jgi:ferredoxin
VSLKVVIDLEICSGTSNCNEESPDAYEVDDRGLAFLKAGIFPDEVLLAGARACPMDAIKLYDASGRQVHP